MTSKEKLEQLIEQGATIYEVKYNNINPVSLKNKIRFIHRDAIVFEPRPDEIYLHHKYLKNLFETLKDAEWQKEFGCIERVERLVLPTWEEKNCIIYTFYSPIKKGGKQYEFRLFKGGNITIWRTNDMYKVFNEPATEENYILACRKAKELFLGENV